MHHGKESNEDAFTRYFQLALEERQGACYYVKESEARQRSAGISYRDTAISVQVFYWVSAPVLCYMAIC